MLARHFHHIHLFANLIPFFGTWGYVIILIASFFEGLPLIGFISPGGISVILGGFLARTHVLIFWKILTFAFIGAFLGDLLAYLIGKGYGAEFLQRYGRYFFLKEAHIVKTQNLLKIHTGKAIIIGRFSYITRCLTPFLAGISDVSLFDFVGFGIISGLIWAIIHILIGFVAGQGYAVAARYINYILLAAIVAIIVIFYGYRFINKRHHIFTRYHIYTLTLNALSIFIFAQALEDIVNRGWLYHFDLFINKIIPSLWNPIMIQIMIVVSDLLTPLNVFLLSCIFIGYLLHRREYYYGLLSFLALILGVIAEYLLKLITSIPRPFPSLLSVTNFSFPSGHATLISIFAFLVFHCLRKNLSNRYQKASLLIGAIFLVLLVGFSRIYLNAHWFSDVLAGYALGIFCVTFIILFLRAASFFSEHLIRWRPNDTISL